MNFRIKPLKLSYITKLKREYMKAQHLIGISFLLLILFLTSCKDKAFTKTKNATKEIHSLDGASTVKIKAYYLTFNPKSNGFIKLELENGAEYEAKSVDGGSFSSINSLIKEPDVLFDTTTTELVVTKSIKD